MKKNQKIESNQLTQEDFNKSLAEKVTFQEYEQGKPSSKPSSSSRLFVPSSSKPTESTFNDLKPNYEVFVTDKEGFETKEN